MKMYSVCRSKLVFVIRNEIELQNIDNTRG